MRRVVVVGGGITGLAAAFELRRHGVEVVVLEASGRVGGKIQTAPFAGVALDAGPDAFLARVPWATQLCEDLGLGGELVAPAATSAFLWTEGQLRRFPERLLLGVPTDLAALRVSGVISAAGLARAEQDLSRTPCADGETPLDAPTAEQDETIGALVSRRLGAEVLDKLVDPLLSGIFAGDTAHLSATAAAPQIVEAARRDTSLMRGARQLLPPAAATNPPPVFLTLRGGLQTLIDAVTRRIGPQHIRTHSDVVAIRRDIVGRFLVDLAGGATIEASHVLVTAPAPAAARLLELLAPDASRNLRRIPYSSVVLVAFAWPEHAIRPLNGSGFLVPRSAGLLMTACSWSSAKFAHLGGNGTARLRVSAGRATENRAMAMDDESLIAALLKDVRTTMGIEAVPQEVRVSRWPECLPQYAVGHLAHLHTIEVALASAAPRLMVTGAAFRGVGLPACIHQGRSTAAALIG